MKKRILNLGCGNDMYGTDRLDFIKTKATTVVHDLTKSFPFPDETFDKIQAHGIFEHLKNPGGFVDEMFRVLKKGGEVDLITSNAGYLVFHVLHDHNAYLEKESYMKTRHPDDFHRQMFVESNLRAYFKDFSHLMFSRTGRDVPGIKTWILKMLPFKMGYEGIRLIAIKGDKEEETYLPVCRNYLKAIK